MIGQLHGELAAVNGNTVLIDVRGIGYELELTDTAIAGLPSISNAVRIYTHFIVREDVQLLYGFASLSERELFRSLIRINGVGPKLGLSILSNVSLPQLARCVSDNDSSVLTLVPGVGKKTAERLLVELKNSIDREFLNVSSDSLDVDREVIQEAERALVGLGYKNSEAKSAVNKAYEIGSSVEELVKAVLKIAASSSGEANDD